MFIIDIKYTVDLILIEKVLAKHRAWLDTQYAKGVLLFSGPKNPRDGGIIIANMENKAQVEELIKEDPYYQSKLAEYKIIEFMPVKSHALLKSFIPGA